MHPILRSTACFTNSRKPALPLYCLISVLVLALMSLLGVGCAHERSFREASHNDDASPAPASQGSPSKPQLEAPPVNRFQGDGPWALFDGKSLAGWEEADYVGKGEVRVENEQLILERGYMTGVRWTNAVFQSNYEVAYEAMRVDGSDFFCGFTFPVNDSFCSFIVGGWGGGVVGLSSLNGEDASSNSTTKYLNFENGVWYRFKVRVTPNRIQTWIDGDLMVDESLENYEVSTRIEMEACKPLGFATWSTTGALRNVVLKKL